MTLRVLDLFSGIGGFSLGLERTGGFETVAFCEIEPFPRRVLAKHWPEVPCYDDVRSLTGERVGPVDVICGGYPCQPFSTAGKRQGASDDRHLWPEFMRLVVELRPAWIIGENVAGHISMGLDDVLADLEAEGYACRAFVIPACAVGASHRRDRVWTVAHAEHGRLSVGWGADPFGENGGLRGGIQSDVVKGRGEQARATVAHAAHMQRNGGEYNAEAGAGQVSELGAGSSAHDVADTISGRRQRQGQLVYASNQAPGGQVEPVNGGQRGKRRTQSRLGGMADGFSCWAHEPDERLKAGVPDRAARLKALGNAVHPDIPMMIGAAILEAEGMA